MKPILTLLLLTATLAWGQVTFVWDPSPSPGVAGYKLWVDTNLMLTVSGTTTQAVARLWPGTHNYYVTATNAMGIESKPSNVLTNRGVWPPANIRISYNRTNDDIRITWSPNDPLDEVIEYHVYEIIGTSKTLMWIALPTQLVYSSVPQPGTHLFCISAVNWGGESPFSATVQYNWPDPPGNLKAKGP